MYILYQFEKLNGINIKFDCRCEAKKFTLTRSQKKVLKKVHKYLATGKKPQVKKKKPYYFSFVDKYTKKDQDIFRISFGKHLRLDHSRSFLISICVLYFIPKEKNICIVFKCSFST